MYIFNIYFRRDRRRLIWPRYKLNRFWQRHVKMRATTQNAWDLVLSLSHSQCPLCQQQRWVNLPLFPIFFFFFLFSSCGSLLPPYLLLLSRFLILDFFILFSYLLSYVSFFFVRETKWDLITHMLVRNWCSSLNIRVCVCIVLISSCEKSTSFFVLLSRDFFFVSFIFFEFFHGKLD